MADETDGTEIALPPPTLTPTYYDLLAREIMDDLDKVAAKIPKLEAHHRATEDEMRAHMNVPRPFLGTAVVAVEETDELQAMRKLDPDQGRETLQFIDAFRIVDYKLDQVKALLRHTIKSRTTALAMQSLQIYAIARGMARDGRHSDIAARVENLRRDLGKRGRPRKK